MKPGDFTKLGEHYRKYRSGYSDPVLKLLIAHTGVNTHSQVVDVGAGTGIWTKQMLDKGLRVTSVEPNDDMRANGEIWAPGAHWKKGTGEETGLPDGYANWVTMASAFHWTDPKVSLPEFHRILKPGGYLTLIWNPLLKEGDALQEEVEALIKRIVPEFERGSRAKDDFDKIIVSTGHFKDVVEIRKVEYVRKPVADYITTWKAVNHLQAVAGPERFARFLSELEEMLSDREYVDVPYLTKCWTAARVD